MSAIEVPTWHWVWGLMGCLRVTHHVQGPCARSIRGSGVSLAFSSY